MADHNHTDRLGALFVSVTGAESIIEPQICDTPTRELPGRRRRRASVSGSALSGIARPTVAGVPPLRDPQPSGRQQEAAHAAIACAWGAVGAGSQSVRQLRVAVRFLTCSGLGALVAVVRNGSGAGTVHRDPRVGRVSASFVLHLVTEKGSLVSRRCDGALPLVR